MSRYLSVEEVMETVGMSRNTVVDAIHEGDLEAYKLRGRWRVPEESVDVWVRGEELEDDANDTDAEDEWGDEEQDSDDEEDEEDKQG